MGMAYLWRLSEDLSRCFQLGSIARSSFLFRRAVPTPQPVPFLIEGAAIACFLPTANADPGAAFHPQNKDLEPIAGQLLL